MANEDLGTLYFKFSAQLDQWNAKLAEADRLYSSYRDKWESTVRFAGGGGGGGGGVGDMAGASRSSGLNVLGTSNGDVSVDLRNAMGRHSSNQNDAVKVARAITRFNSGSDRFAGDFSEDDMSEASRMKKDADMATVLRKGNEVAAYDMRKKQAAGEDAQLDSLRAGDAKSPGGLSLLTKKISHVAIRSFAATLVVDAVAGELNNEENYKKAATLAGNNQGALSVAQIARTRGAFEAVPLLGGLAYNVGTAAIGAFGGVTPQQIETQNALNEQRNGYDDFAKYYRLKTTQTRLAGSSADASPIGLTRRRISMQSERIGRDADLQSEYETALSKAGMEGHQEATKLENFVAGTSVTVQQQLEEKVAKRNREIDDRNADRKRVVDSMFSGRRSANVAADSANDTDLARQGQYQANMGVATVARMQGENAYRPTAAAAGFAVASARALIGYEKSPNMTDNERTILTSQVQEQIEGLRSQKRDIDENFRYGRGEQYDPFNQSTAGFTDRGTESQSDKTEALIKAIEELTQDVRALRKGP